MPQRICSRKTPLIKANTKRVSKKNLKVPFNGSITNSGNVKASTPPTVITKVKQGIEGKWKTSSIKTEPGNTEYRRDNASEHIVRHDDGNVTQMYYNSTPGNSVGKYIFYAYIENIC